MVSPGGYSSESRRRCKAQVPHPPTCTCPWGGSGHFGGGPWGPHPRKYGALPQPGMGVSGKGLQRLGLAAPPMWAGGPGQLPDPRDLEGTAWLCLGPGSCPSPTRSAPLSLPPEPSLSPAMSPPRAHWFAPRPPSDPGTQLPLSSPFLLSLAPPGSPDRRVRSSEHSLPFPGACAHLWTTPSRGCGRSGGRGLRLAHHPQNCTSKGSSPLPRRPKSWSIGDRPPDPSPPVLPAPHTRRVPANQ